MTTLTPKQAAAIASGVYELQNKTVADVQRTGGTLGCEELFPVGDTTRFLGSSGMVAKATTGFGYITSGTGRTAGEILCVTRGTSSLFDWGTNANVGLSLGPGGHLVHTGFNDLWKSFSAAINEYLRGRNPTHVHCVGHSLGGALAMLNADYLTANKVAAVSVYTFGAPRVGYPPFAEALTHQLNGRIFRVSHVADPVPMIPLWPFHHAPTTGPGYTVGSRTGSSISVSAHYMAGSYIPTIGDHAWETFLSSSPDVSEAEVKTWMSTTSGGSQVAMFSANALWMIGRVLRWLLKKAGELLAISVNIGFTLSLTALDQMAWMIGRAAELTKDMASYTTAMIQAIFRFLGRVAATATELTTSFLRWVLGLLFSTVSGLALRATSLI